MQLVEGDTPGVSLDELRATPVPCPLLTGTKLEEKLGRSDLTEALIAAPAPAPLDTDEINERLRLMWTQGINLYHHSIEDLADVLLSLVGEDGRRDFIVEVGGQLDKHAPPSSRLSWRNLLERVLDGGQTTG